LRGKVWVIRGARMDGKHVRIRLREER
jgi:hypothetical protein